MKDSSVSNNKVGAHTPEPWPKFSIDFCVPATPDPQSEPVVLMSPEDYIRAAACVNACAGIATAELEEEGKDALDLAANIKEIVQQRDELAEALRPFAGFACDEPCLCHNCKARAALAKLDTDSTKGSKR